MNSCRNGVIYLVQIGAWDASLPRSNIASKIPTVKCVSPVLNVAMSTHLCVQSAFTDMSRTPL